MKRLTVLLLILCLFLSGCEILGDRIKEPVTFYYIRPGYQDDMTEVIASEEREASGHRHDLSYLLALYLMGPTDEELNSPVPPGTRILVDTQDKDSIILNMADTSKTLTDAEFSLACDCLTLTCLELTEAEEVTVNSADRSVTMSRDNLTLFDNSEQIAENATTEETQ